MVKYRRAALWAALFFSSFGFAWQTPFSGGLNIGGGVSKFSSKELGPQDTSSSWSLGTHLSWRTLEWLSFEPGLQFSKESDFSFATLPLLTKLSMPFDSGIEPYAFIGPYFSVAVSKASAGMKGFDFGSLQGIGCFFPLSHRFGLNADLRFRVGAIDLDPIESVSLRARSLQMNLAGVFPL